MVEVVTAGETMVAFVSSSGAYKAVVAGAESNVAMSLSGLGVSTRWVSRLGDDPLGNFVADAVAGAGVELAVVRDAARPTGVMVVHERKSTYYRRGSAASALGFGDLERLGEAGWVLVTGITPALSASAAELVEAIVVRRRHGARVAFDVNHRPALWPDDAIAGRVLGDLCRAADLVFVGEDEAEALFGTSDNGSLARMILRRGDQELVLKRGPGAASLITLSGEVSEPALPARVVDPIGAGDGFAAGYLAATVWGWPDRARLRMGHLMGSRVLEVLDHVPPPFTDDEVARLSPEHLAAMWAITK